MKLMTILHAASSLALSLALTAPVAADFNDKKPITFSVDGATATGYLKVVTESLNGIVREAYPGTDATYKPGSPAGGIQNIATGKSDFAFNGAPPEIAFALEGKAPFKEALTDKFKFVMLLHEGLVVHNIATKEWAEKNGKMHAYNFGMHVKTTSVLGFLMVRSLAWLKPWRPRSFRYHVEQLHIDAWLARIREAAQRDTGLALEIAECATLVKGYSDTHRRGMANFLALMDALVDNPPTSDPREQAAAIAKARKAALADPEGKALSGALGTPLVNGKPVFWLAKSP